MVYLFTALYCEAQIFIESFHLKKVMESTRFQQFYNGQAGMCLTVTGTGEIAAAAAASSVFTAACPGPADFLINVGICAGTKKSQGIYLINKITEQASGKDFYPDMLLCHNFQEESLVTASRPWAGQPGRDVMELYDMEAAAIYQAAAYFIGPHQMAFLKIISDNGADAHKVDKAYVANLMGQYREKLLGFVSGLSQIGSSLQAGGDGMENGACDIPPGEFQSLCEGLHCSKAMEESLRQYIRYASLSGAGYASVVQGMYQEGRLPCRNKKEGKLRLEELKQRLL